MLSSDQSNNPDLTFDLNKGLIKISGKSTMAQPQNFYPSVINLIEEYYNNPHFETHLIIDLDYYNTLSSRFLLKIVELVSKIELRRYHTVEIDWHYDPDDHGIAEDIKIFSKIIQFRINAISYELR